MKLNLEKWLNNKTDANFKRIFNDNVEKINNVLNYFIKKDKATNNRINNLILKSGGNSPNEVVDARTDSDGQVHSVLKERLDNESAYFKEKDAEFEKLIEQSKKEYEELKNSLTRLYSEQNATVDIYVSKNGSNSSGDGTEEKPFLTIQKAVDSIPFISTGTYIIWVDKGSYLEHVAVRGINSRNLEIRSTNYATIESNTKDTGTYIRSIHLDQCPGYAAVRGLTLVDTKNTQRGIYFSYCGYGAIDRCPVQENTKGSNYRAYEYNASKGHVYQSDASNQELVLNAQYTSDVVFANTMSGKNNATSIMSSRSTVFFNNSSIEGEQKKEVGGQIY